MAISAWLRPPKHMLILFLGITVALTTGLGWLGWRMLRQDQALTNQRIQDRLLDAADLLAAALQGRLAATEETLSRLSALPVSELSVRAPRYADGLAEGAVIVVFGSTGADAHPGNRLLYYPVVPQPDEPPASVFSRGESLEFRQQDYYGAAEAFRRVARSRDSTTRAGGLLRLGRALRNANRLEPALAAFGDLALMQSTPVFGVPAELQGRYARLTVLDELGQDENVRREAESLHADLHAGRWRITRARYEFYAREVRRRLRFGAGANPPPPDQWRLATAAGVELLWLLWRSGDRDSLVAGRRTARVEGSPVFLIWRGTPDYLVGLVVSRRFLELAWLEQLAPLMARNEVDLALSDSDGELILTQFGGDASHEVIRTAVETGLPWTLHVASADPSAMLAELADRRRIMVLGMITFAMLIVLGAYAVTRAVSRELKVARLQSEFVAAVSHDFRTPLTSLRQLTELLSTGRVPSDQRRKEYYTVLQRECERLHRLVEGLLDFGRMEAGALEFEMESLNSAELVRAVVEEFRAERAGGDHEIALTIEDNQSTVQADGTALSRALWNLLDNAVKYSPDHRTVRVDVSHDGDLLAIRVHDRGVGIPRDLQGEIFKKFVRGDTAQVAGVKGTGIGLAMVRHIVEAHGGHITLESTPGAGSTFTIMLPAET